MKDGWHTIKGYEVFVENDCITHGIKYDSNGSPVTSYPYKWLSREQVWSSWVGVKASTFARSDLYIMS